MSSFFSREGKWILPVAAILLFTALGRSDIYILDEARNAQCAREMWHGSEWGVPTFNNELRPHKPPLHYFFMKMGYALLGDTAAGARFFSAAMGVLLLVYLYGFVKKHLGNVSAFWTVALLTASAHFIFEFRLAVPDPYLITFITLGVCLFYDYTQSLRWGPLLLSAVCGGLAVLAKGPVALVLPGAAIAGWLITGRQWRLLLSWKMAVYLLVVAAVAVPWFYLVHRATGGLFTKEFFFTHNISRFQSPMEGHGGLFLLVPLFVLLGFLPFACFIAPLVQSARQGQFKKSLLSLCVWMAAVFIIFFSISGTKLPNYPMPCYAFIAIPGAAGIQHSMQWKKKWPVYTWVLLLVIYAALAAGAYAGLKAEQPAAHLNWLAIFFAVPLAGIVLAWRQQAKESLHKALLYLLYTALLFNFVFNVFMYPAVYRQNPVTQTRVLLPRNATVMAYKIYNPAFNFYLDSAVNVYEHIEQLDSALRRQPGAFVISRSEMMAELEQLRLQTIAVRKDLFENPVTVLLKAK
jgi:4-amino-4-deoxy-L-arabinose transferase-like glycosyltransferase